MRWNNVEEIVDGLEENYPEIELDDLSLTDLEDMVKSLSDFEDHETIVTKKLLNGILEAWLEYREEI
jgi:FeS assembly protein IscX